MSEEHDEARAIETVRRRAPDALRLAELASLATFVDGDLLRALRLELARDVDVGAESDLWFGPLVESRGVNGIKLTAGVAGVLRDGLARRPAELAAVRRVMAEAHGSLAPEVQIEERVNALAVAGGNAALEDIEAALRPLVPGLMATGREGEDLCRWALRASAAFHPVVRQAEAAQLLVHLATLRLGRPSVVPEPPSERVSFDALGWALGAVASASRIDVGVLRVAPGIQFVDPAHGARLPVPRTHPPVVQLEWDGGKQRRLVEATPGTTAALPGALDEIVITTLAGERFRLLSTPQESTPEVDVGELESMAPPAPAPPAALLDGCLAVARGGGGPPTGVAFAVAPGVFVTAAAAVSGLRVVTVRGRAPDPGGEQLEVIRPRADHAEVAALVTARPDTTRWPVLPIADHDAAFGGGSALLLAVDASGPRWLECVLAAADQGDPLRGALVPDPPLLGSEVVVAALLGAPVVIGGEVIGAVVQVHTVAGGPRAAHVRLCRVADLHRARAEGISRAKSTSVATEAQGRGPGTALGARGVRAIALDPRGDLLFAAKAHGTVRVRDVATGRLRTTLYAPESRMTAVALPPDPRFAVTGTEAGGIFLWDVHATRVVRTLLSGGAPVFALAATPDGRMIAGTADGGLSIWDLQGGRVASMTGHRDAITGLGIAEDGSTLVSGSLDGRVVQWDLRSHTLREAHEFDAGVLSIATGGGGIVAAGTTDGVLHLWAARGSSPEAARRGTAVRALAVAPGGVVLAAAGDVVERWKAAGARWVSDEPLGSGGAPIETMRLSSDGTTLATGSSDGTIAIWDLARGRLARVIGTPRVHVVAAEAEERFAAAIRVALSDRLPGEIPSSPPSKRLRIPEDGAGVDEPRPEVLVVVVGPAAARGRIPFLPGVDLETPGLRLPLRAIIPVLVGGASPSVLFELPGPLRRVSQHQSFELHGDPPARSDLGKLADAVEAWLDEAERGAPPQKEIALEVPPMRQRMENAPVPSWRQAPPPSKRPAPAPPPEKRAQRSSGELAERPRERVQAATKKKRRLLLRKKK